MNFFCIYGCDIFSQCVLCITIYLFCILYILPFSYVKVRLFRFANLECECVTLIILEKITLSIISSLEISNFISILMAESEANMYIYIFIFLFFKCIFCPF